MYDDLIHRGEAIKMLYKLAREIENLPAIKSQKEIKELEDSLQLAKEEIEELEQRVYKLSIENARLISNTDLKCPFCGRDYVEIILDDPVMLMRLLEEEDDVVDDIAATVAASMALSGFELTDEDKERIREKTGSEEEIKAEIERLVEKHKREEHP